MFREIFLLLLLGHVLGDFYTQTSKIAEKKKDECRGVLIHGLIYMMTIFVVSIPVISLQVFIINILVAITHIIIDILKYFYVKRKKDSSKIFVIDQSLHLICLIIISYICAINNVQLHQHIIISDFFDTVQLSEIMLCKWLVGLLIIHKPANILIQKLLLNYRPKLKVDTTEIKVDNNVGRIIGSVERAIMFLLIYIHQYSAIGLVLTAKSIARYDKISKEKDFAEYYLLGTLISLGIVMVCAVLLFGV